MLRDKRTGEAITGDSVTQRLKEMGVVTDGDSREVQETAQETEEAVRPIDEPEQESSRELSEFEQEQVAKGWDPDGEKTAEEFARAEPLYGEISKRGKRLKEKDREIDDLRQTMNELKEHLAKQQQSMQQQQQIGYQRALEELYERRVDAIEAGNVQEVANLDQQINETSSQMQNIQRQELPAPAKAFYERNKDWLESKDATAFEIREYADKRDKDLTRFNLPLDEHVRILEGDIQKKFADRFGETAVNSPTVQAVEANTKTNTPRRSKYTINDLSDIQKACCNRFVKNGIMTAQQYIQQLVDMGELK